MSWWPSSGAGTDAKAQPQSQPQMPAQASQPQTQAALSGPAPPSPPTQPDTAPHDPDFYAAHPHLAPPSFSTSTSQSTSTQPSKEDYEPLDPHLPYTMSCRAAFDSAFYCSSLGGHFNDIYRYGQLRSCSDNWNDFWFCMRTKNSYNPREIKERLVQERYREKEKKVKSGPNSEDVWRERREGERVVGAFGMGNESGEGA